MAWAKRRSTAGKRSRARKPGTTILHPCGHAEAHVLRGKTWQKDREKVRLAGRPCTPCWARAQAEASEALCGVENLPDLDGTEGRVLWARSIRANFIGRVLGEASRLDRARLARGLAPARERYLALAVPAILKKESAKWWIDHQEDPDLLDQMLGVRDQQGLERLLKETAETALIECPF